MRKRLAMLALTLACGNKSKLDDVNTSAIDALWDLAPDKMQIGFVASPKATDLIARGISAVEALAATPDGAPAKDFVDRVVTALYGSPTGKPADAGLATDRGFAMFVTEDGVLGVMPIADRDKFVTSKGGHHGSGSAAGTDTINGNPCQQIRDVYVCATNDKMFDRLGKGSLRGKSALAGGRGDAELYAPALPLLGGTPGELAVVAALTDGRVALRGRYTGAFAGTLTKLVATTAPKVDPTGASGFVALDVSGLLADLPPVPLTSDVTIADLAKTIKGPVTITVPSGSLDLQFHVPLSDPGPATKALEHCDQIELFERADKQVPGACRFKLQAATVFELDAWVEGNELRLGAHKGPATPGKPDGTTAIGRELAAGDWSAVFWGCGSMLQVANTAPPGPDLPPEAALAIHAIALVNEVGAGIKLDPTGATFVMYLRTAWINPPDVVAKLIAFSGNDIANGKASEPAKAIAAAAPTSPFAKDFAAGQGGLIVPAAVIGLVAALVVPALRSAATEPGGGVEAEPDQPPRVDQAQLVALLVHAYVEEAFPAWQAANPGKACPASLAELASFLGAPPDVPTLTDAWNQPLVMLCGKDLPPGAKHIAVLSVGPDGKQGTPDDVRSWDPKP